MPPLDLSFVRQQFPAFAEPSLSGWAFFENAGGSYACRQVIDRLTSYYRQTKVQPYGCYPASRAAGEAMDASYTRLAAYLNVAPDEVHFGPSTSQNTYVLAQAFAESWQAGDELIVTNQDHEANSGVWRKLAHRGIVVKEWKIDPETGQLALDTLEPLLSDRTRLVAFPHCSNVIGQLNPVREIVDRVHAVGGLAIVDGVAAAPHGLPDVAALGADVYLFSLYKTFGPHQGLMVVRRPLLERLPNQSHFFNAEILRKKLVPAGPDHAQIAAAAGIADYFDALDAHHFPEAQADDRGAADGAARSARVRELLRSSERVCLEPLLAWLAGRDDLRIVGTATGDARAPTVAVELRGKSLPAVLGTLEQQRIMAGGGHFYAVRPLRAMGIPETPGVLRLSFLHYTTPAEITQLCNALEHALA
jgi:cysteine desulfurase family protein (TIGR01976 family)